MPNLDTGIFPTMGEIMNLARSKVNDTFRGLRGEQGRILSNSAKFTLPFFNDALKTIGRKLRVEGVKWPVEDNYIMFNVTALAETNPAIQIYIGYDGFFDGIKINPIPRLPPNLAQPYDLWEQNAGSGLPFYPMAQPQGGLPSCIQGPRLGVWEWRKNRIYMVGSTQTKNLRLKFLSGVPNYFTIDPLLFDETPVGIADCSTAMANLIAAAYGGARGGDAQGIAGCLTAADDAIEDMANEAIRRQQTQTFRRRSYNSGGSGENGDTTGATGVVG